MKPYSTTSDLRWIEIVTTAGLAAVMLTVAGVAIWQEIKVDDVLGLLGAILGAGIGAWLAATAGRTAMRLQRLADEQDRRTFVKTLLTDVSEDLQKGSTVEIGHKQVTVSTHFGETQVQLLALRARRALSLVEDANAKVGADYRALRAFHVAIRTLRDIQEESAAVLDRQRTPEFGEGAMIFVQTTRNSVRMTIEQALIDLESPSAKALPIEELSPPAAADPTDATATDAASVSSVPVEGR